MSSWDWDVLWGASTAVVASESVRLAMRADGGMWSKKGIHTAFGLCSKPFPGPKSSMLSSFQMLSAPTINPYGRPSTTRNVSFRTRVSAGNFMGKVVDPSIRMGGGLFEGGLAACRAPRPCFVRGVTDLPNRAVM